MTKYHNWFLQINRANDPASLTEMEQKHIPVLKTPEKLTAGKPFLLEVSVGRIQHPVENDHYIQFIDLYVGEVYLTRLTFTPVVLLPQATLSVNLKQSGLLRAVSRCNLHGQWEGTLDLHLAEEPPPHLKS